MKKKILSLMIMVLIVLGCFVGCGNIKIEQENSTVGTEWISENVQNSDNVFSEVTLNINVAASLKDTITEISEIYNEIQPNVKIIINADSSGTLQKQIEEAAGTDIDMFFSASTKQMEKLQEEGYIEDNSVSNLLKNQVVLISAKGSGTKVTGFENITNAKNFALAGESVPVGQYSREIFATLGITGEVNAMEINQCDNVSAVKNAVVEGSNEVGTVYYSDYNLVKDKVDLIEKADESWCNPIVYPVGIVKNPNADENQKKAIEDFNKFLQTDEAKEVFEKYMFIVNN